MSQTSLIGETLTLPPARTHVLDLYGNGQIAHALLPRLEQVGLRVHTIRDSRGIVHEDDHAVGAPVAVDCTAPYYDGPRADAWDDTLVSLLESGTPLVTCNKAPLARSWRRLEHAARRGGSTILASATVGAGTPVLATLRRVAAAHGLVRLEAIVSGTLSAVVRDIARGLPLDEAVRAAQAAGVAEPDPTLDLNGTDAYAKGLILHNAFFRDHAPLDLASQRHTFRIDDDVVRAAVRDGLVAEPITVVEPGSVRVELAVRAREDALLPPPGHAAVRATALDGESYRLSGPAAGPAVTAGGLLADLLSLDERRRRGAIGIGP